MQFPKHSSPPEKAASMPVFVSREVREHRASLCATCPSKTGSMIPRCSQMKCGCPIASVTRLQRSTCPRGLW